MTKKIKFKHYVETLLQIIEDKSKQEYPLVFYYVMILIMYCQFTGYIFSTYETKPLVDENIRYFAHVMENSTGTFLLFVTGNDTLTLIVFVLFEICLYGYIFYIILLTYLRLFQKEFLQKTKGFFKTINYFLQLFFSCFLWIFYIPFTEIHSGMAVCGSNSFLSAYRGPNGCDIKPLYQIFLGVFGVVLTFFTGCLLNYFYVSYEFEEKNLLKRRFSWNLIIQMLARSLLVTLYYLKLANIALIKHITSHILGITSCLDIMVNMPFRNKNIMLFYGTVTFIYEATMILFSMWDLTIYLPEYNLFYFWCINMPLAFGLMYCLWNYTYNSLMKLNSEEMGRYYYILDQYLEEISSLTEKSESEKVSKVKICGILRNHLNSCNDPLCMFKKNSKFENFLDENLQIDSKKLTKILNNWFTMFLNHNLFKNNQSNNEYLSLKYCSFLANYQDNPIRAYYEIKTLLNKDKRKDEKTENSLFFRLLSKIISKNIENLIMQQMRFERGGKNADDSSGKHEFFYSATLYKMEKFKRKFVTQIIEISMNKKDFWEKLLGGYNTIDEYLSIALKLSKKINKLKDSFMKDHRNIRKSADRENILFLKISSIFNSVILNDILASYKIENKINEIKKRESLISKECISSISIIKGNSITLTASLLNDTGKILSKKDEKTAAFFDYSFEDFENIDNISAIMPENTAHQHPKFINRYVENGRSECVQSSRLVFCKNRLNFIFPTKIFYNFIFDYVSNFGICATITKIETSSFYVMFDVAGMVTTVSQNLKESLKIQDKLDQFCSSKFNILNLIPNLFDNVNFPILEDDDHKRKDLKIILVSKEKFWFYPPRREVKGFLENFYDFIKNREAKAFDVKNADDRNLFKSFLISEDSKSNLRKVLASLSLTYHVNYLNDGFSYHKYCIEITEIFLNQMMDPDQSTGLRLTENLTENSKNFLKQGENNSDEDNSNNKIDYVLGNLLGTLAPNKSSGKPNSNLNQSINLNESPELKKADSNRKVPDVNDNLIPQLTPSSVVNISQQANISKKPNISNPNPTNLNNITIIPTDDAPNFINAIFDKPIQKKKDDDSIQPIPFSKDLDENFNSEGIPKNQTFAIISSEANAHKTEKGVKNEDERSEEEAKKSSCSVDKDKNSAIKNDSPDEENFVNAVSVSSGSSLSTNYGSLFLKDLVHGNYNPAIVKKIFVISVFQILFFFTINLIYVFLLNDRLVSFQVNLDGMETPHYFLNSYSKNLVAMNFQYLYSENIISENSVFISLTQELENSAYQILQNKLMDFKKDSYYYSVIEFENIIKTFSDNIQSNVTLDYFQFLNLIEDFSYLANKSQDINLNNYYFFLNNYDTMANTNIAIEMNFLSEANNNKDSLSVFYLILSIVGLTVAIFLQLINIPFFIQYYTLIEKILMVVARITETECNNEIKIYDNYVAQLKSKTDEYLNHEFLAEEKIKKKKIQFVQTSVTNAVKKHSNYTSGYLSSRISNQKLRRVNTHLLNLLTIVIVTIFFSVVFVYAGVIQDLLDNSVNLDQNIAKLSNSIDILETLPNILLTNDLKTKETALKPEEFQSLLGLYNRTFADFSNYYNSFLNDFMYNSDIASNYVSTLENIMSNDDCQVFSMQHCQLLTNNNFFYGLNGYFAFLVKNLNELNPYILQNNSLNSVNEQVLFGNDVAFQNLLNILLVFSVRDQFVIIAKEALDDQINKAYQGILLLFLLGGSACSFILSIIFLSLFFKIKTNYMNLRTILLLIPFKKLREDSTLYLLRNLQKF